MYRIPLGSPPLIPSFNSLEIWSSIYLVRLSKPFIRPEIILDISSKSFFKCESHYVFLFESRK